MKTHSRSCLITAAFLHSWISWYSCLESTELKGIQYCICFKGFNSWNLPLTSSGYLNFTIILWILDQYSSLRALIHGEVPRLLLLIIATDPILGHWTGPYQPALNQFLCHLSYTLDGNIMPPKQIKDSTTKDSYEGPPQGGGTRTSDPVWTAFTCVLEVHMILTNKSTDEMFKRHNNGISDLKLQAAIERVEFQNSIT